jgi:hypothetical protein
MAVALATSVLAFQTVVGSMGTVFDASARGKFSALREDASVAVTRRPGLASNGIA